ncbi:protein kinase domain-containing protein [Crateriforma spongiae]|uniref:serine/threonine-protein kinase n=1 Tax=Crateriforma spongiae TaxID=2724528 RepID=UPI0039AF611B
MMPEEATEHSRVEALAAEFAEKLRDGENPSLDDYVARNPDCGPELRELLLTILAMEELKNQNSPDAPPTMFGPVGIKQLGDLRIVREIGRGGMGIVYEAVQESLGRTVAVKVLPKGRLENEQALARFQREARTAASLHHTNIVPVLGVGVDDGYYYYVMQLVRGVGLDEVIDDLRADTAPSSQTDSPTVSLTSVAHRLIQRSEEASTLCVAQQDAAGEADGSACNAGYSIPSAGRPRRSDRAYWQSVAWIAHRVATALQYAHDQGILHRDIKPSNLLVDSHGDVSVADFGLAKSTDQAGISRPGDVVGTLRYMAPEQLAGAADNRSDVYSLGVTLYELATLRPFYDEAELAKTLTHGGGLKPARPSEIRPDLPRDLGTIIVKAMDVEPAKRYQTAAEMSEDLRRFCEDRPILAKRTSVFEHFWRWSRRNPAVATLGIVAAALVVAVAAVSTTAYYRTNLARQEAIEQRNKADETAESAFDALDEIFHSLAPMPMVNPDEFVDSSDLESAPPAAPIPRKQTAALLEKMLTFYGRLAESGQTDERYGQRLAEAHHRIGDIRQRLGQVEIAASSYRRSAELYRHLITTDPSPTLVARLAAVHNQLGICAHHLRRQRTPLPENSQQHDRSHGLAEFQAARLLLEPIATANSPPEVRYELAHTYYLLGDQPSDGRHESHDGDHERQLTESADNIAGIRRDRQQTESIGESARFSRRAPDREVLLQRAAETLRQLLKDYPESPDYRRLLAMCYMENSKELWISAYPQGRQPRLDAIEILTPLVEEFPENPDYRFALSSAHAIGRVNSPWLDRDAIRAYIDRLETAESLISDLRAEHPNVPQYLVAHVKLFRQLATLHRRLGGRSAQLPVYRRASQVCRDARPDSITNVSFKSVIEVYDRTADLLLAEASGNQQENLVEALAVLKAGIHEFERLEIRASESNGHPVRVEFLARLADVQERLGHTASTNSTQPPE